MREYYPILLVGAIVGILATVFIIAFATMKDKKEAFGFERNMKDSEIIRRLLRYAKPYWKNYILIFFVLIVSIVYDIVSPRIVGGIEEMVKGQFEMPALFRMVLLYAGILIVSLVGNYIQAIQLQKVGQKILTAIREDLFVHIESLSHDQLNHIPVGKLVTRECNDTNAISMLFTNILVNFFKNILIIVGVFAAMLTLNYELTLMVTCFVPFIVLFTMIFRKFSRRAYRRVKDGTTDINTFLSENLSGIKITQIFNNEEKKLGEFREKNVKLAKARGQEILVFSIFRPVVYMLYISSVMLLLYLGVLLPGLRIAWRCEDDRGRLLAIGACTLVFAHVYVNIAMSIGLMPITGLPLPLISAGRTFLVVVMAALGLVQSVAVHGETKGES